MDKANRKMGRLLSLDVFRGFTIAAMILVNSTGIYNTQNYGFLEHAEWNGCNPADLIFPFFLFIVGVAIPIAFSKRLEAQHPLTKLIFKIIRRVVNYFFTRYFFKWLSLLSYNYHAYLWSIATHRIMLFVCGYPIFNNQ